MDHLMWIDNWESEVDKELYSLTKDFTMEDWEIIRTPKHWAKRDSIRAITDKNEFLLKEVKKYLGL